MVFTAGNVMPRGLVANARYRAMIRDVQVRAAHAIKSGDHSNPYDAQAADDQRHARFNELLARALLAGPTTPISGFFTGLLEGAHERLEPVQSLDSLAIAWLCQQVLPMAPAPPPVVESDVPKVSHKMQREAARALGRAWNQQVKERVHEAAEAKPPASLALHPTLPASMKTTGTRQPAAAQGADQRREIANPRPPSAAAPRPHLQDKTARGAPTNAVARERNDTRIPPARAPAPRTRVRSINGGVEAFEALATQWGCRAQIKATPFSTAQRVAAPDANTPAQVTLARSILPETAGSVDSTPLPMDQLMQRWGARTQQKKTRALAPRLPKALDPDEAEILDQTDASPSATALMAGVSARSVEALAAQWGCR
jgi:hypothetical protein